MDLERSFSVQIEVSNMSLDLLNFFPSRDQAYVAKADKSAAHLQDVHLVEFVEVVRIDMEEQGVPQHAHHLTCDSHAQADYACTEWKYGRFHVRWWYLSDQYKRRNNEETKDKREQGRGREEEESEGADAQTLVPLECQSNIEEVANGHDEYGHKDQSPRLCLLEPDRVNQDSNSDEDGADQSQDGVLELSQIGLFQFEVVEIVWEAWPRDS